MNPATGERQLVLIGAKQEIAMGQQADEGVMASYGLYPDEDWQEYIQALGASLAATSERPELPWTFRVVDDPIVNAFALPGGFIYVTRGILGHFNSEAELSSVLGHEIGHVTGRHGVERASRAQLASVGLGVAMIAPGFRQLSQLAQQGLSLLFLKFGRNDERQADDLGLRYMTNGGYDQSEMPKVFQTLDRVSSASGGSRLPSWLSTHPDPGNRAARISEQVAALPVSARGEKVLRDSYLERLDGLTFGTNPREGYFIENRFYHPDMRFQMQFPNGWKTTNQRSSVGALSEAEDAVVVLSLATESTVEAASAAFYEEKVVTKESEPSPGYSYFSVRSSTESENSSSSPPELAGAVRFLSHQGNILRVLGLAKGEVWRQKKAAIDSSVRSFASLSNQKYVDVHPQRIELVRIDRSMSLTEFDQRYPSTLEVERLAILNGVDEQQVLEKGRLVKRVVGGKLPKD